MRTRIRLSGTGAPSVWTRGVRGRRGLVHRAGRGSREGRRGRCDGARERGRGGLLVSTTGALCIDCDVQICRRALASISAAADHWLFLTTTAGIVSCCGVVARTATTTTGAASCCGERGCVSHCGRLPVVPRLGRWSAIQIVPRSLWICAFTPDAGAVTPVRFPQLVEMVVIRRVSRPIDVVEPRR